MNLFTGAALGLGSLFSGIFSGIFGSKAGASAAQAQMYSSKLGYQAIQDALGEYRHEFDVLQQNLQPFIQAGTGALGEITALMGLPEAPEFQYGGMEYKRDPFIKSTKEHVGGLAPGKKILYTPEFETSSQEQLVARLGEEGASEALSRPITQEEIAQGYREIEGPSGVFRIPVKAGLSGEERQQAAYKAIEESPEFLERVRVGEEALLNRASVTGGLRGGNLQAALAQFRPQILSQLINEKIANLGGLAGLGQSSAAGVGAGAMQLGQGSLIAGINAANILGQGGMAQAQGILGGYQAWQPLMNLPSDILKSYVLGQGFSGKSLFGG